MPDRDVGKQLHRWVHAAQSEDNSASTLAWLDGFFRGLDLAVATTCLDWPTTLRAPVLRSTDEALEFLVLSRQMEARVLGLKTTSSPDRLTTDLLVGALAEDVIHLFVRGADLTAADNMHVECEVNGDVVLVASVARVAAALIISRRCHQAGDDAPVGLEPIVDSRGLGAIIESMAEVIDTRDYNYGEAMAACHRAHVQRARSTAVGLHAFEQTIWLRSSSWFATRSNVYATCAQNSSQRTFL